MLSQVFENRQNLARLSGAVRISRIRRRRRTTRALYIAAWIEGRPAGRSARKPCDHLAGARTLFVELDAPTSTLRVERQDQRMITTVNGFATAPICRCRTIIC